MASSSRGLSARLSAPLSAAALVAVVGGLLLLSDPAFACSCMMSHPQEQACKAHFSKSSNISTVRKSISRTFSKPMSIKRPSVMQIFMIQNVTARL